MDLIYSSTKTYPLNSYKKRVALSTKSEKLPIVPELPVSYNKEGEKFALDGAFYDFYKDFISSLGEYYFKETFMFPFIK